MTQLLNSGNEREHDLDLPVRRCSQQRAQLRAEHVAEFHAEPQCAQTENRVVFLLADDLLGDFFSAEVEGADDAPIRRDRFRQTTIDVEMLFFVREHRRLGDVEEFGTIEADAFGAESIRVFEFFDQLDVRLQRDVDVVFRDRGNRAVFEETLF